jgi:hypothetical protein
LYCAGCGTTRALHALFNGSLADAWRFNPLAMLAGAMLPGYIWYCGGPFQKRVLHESWIWAVLVTIVAFSIGRNVPFYPFTLLAPP